MTERYMVDDAGSLIDMQTRDTFDYVSDVCDVLNEQDKSINELKKENENLNNVLEDFMTITNRLQSEPHNKSLPLMARDMLRMMGKDIMGDSE